MSDIFDWDNIPENDDLGRKTLSGRGIADLELVPSKTKDRYDLLFRVKTGSFNLKFKMDFEQFYGDLQDIMNSILKGMKLRVIQCKK